MSNRNIKKNMGILAICSMCFLAGCGKQEGAINTETSDIQEELQIVSVHPVIHGYEWGPGVDEIVVEVNQAYSATDELTATITTRNVERNITNIYLSDEKGIKKDNESSFVTIQMQVTSTNCGTPFDYDYKETLHNQWAKEYPVDVTIKSNEGEINWNGDCIKQMFSPDADLFQIRGSYSGTYLNPYTNQQEDITLTEAIYEPESIAGGEKNPLIIWLHGQGEGGTDPDIAILGNQVTMLAKSPIQDYFISGNEVGAYVLAVQTPTYWMDAGDGVNSQGNKDSRYTEALMDTIKAYVDTQSDIDTGRIYLGGCSNGGYMTMNMLISYPDYFAAAYPCCEAYAFFDFETGEQWFTKEKVDRIKDIPLWFVQSANDKIVDPVKMALPSYQLLLQEGADNCWFSYFENVTGTDENKSFQGHWSWFYIFHDQVTKSQNPEAVLEGSQDNNYGFVATNDGGGQNMVSDQNGEYQSLFQWLNAQKK